MLQKSIYFIGQVGSDAGGWYIGADGKIHRVPGWNPEAMNEVAAALNIVRYSNLVKNSHFSSQIMKEALNFAQGQLGEHIKDGGVVVVNSH